MWDDEDFMSDDPLVRYNAHQAAKGRRQMPDPDELRKRERENADRLVVLGQCRHGFDLDREFCPHGCRV